MKTQSQYSTGRTIVQHTWFFERARERLLSAATVAVTAMLATACASNADNGDTPLEGPKQAESALELAADVASTEAVQQSDVVFSATFSSGKASYASSNTGSVKYEASQPSPKKSEVIAGPPVERIAPSLLQDVTSLEGAGAATSADRSVRVVLTFVQDQKIPRFPEPVETEARDSATNLAAQARAQTLVSQLQNARASTYDAKAAELLSQHQAKEVDRFWLISGMAMDVPLSQIRGLSQRADVQYVEYEAGAALPHAGDNISDARALLGTDSYFSFTGNWIGMLDGGIRTSHVLLSSPNIFDFVRDCVNGTSNNCSTGTGLDPDDACNHGTAAASIISGNNNLTNTSRGVSPIIIDSWKIATGCLSNVTAEVRAFQAAVASSDRVIMANIQEGGNETSAPSTAADSAFDSGSVVIAAAGNNGPGATTVSSPGNAHKTLATGAIDTLPPQTLQNYSGRGPTGDSRFKPDVVMPTNTHAASTASNNALFNTFGGTSGATPYGTGTAALARNLLRGANATIDPGQVYAYLIMSGQQRFFNNDIGSGRVILPQLNNTQVWWTSVNVTNGQTASVAINVGFTPSTAVGAAIWWPETTSTHNDVDLEMVRPNNTSADSSVTVGSIFEKVSTASSLQSGNWTFRVKGYSVTGTQKVYLAVTAR